MHLARRVALTILALAIVLSFASGDAERGRASGAVVVSGGLNYTCAVTAAGAAKCWGSSNSGQAGIVAPDCGGGPCSVTPRDVIGLSNGVTDIAADHLHSCAVVSGAAVCWGANGGGQLGDGTQTSRGTPGLVFGLSNVVDIDVGDSHSCAVLSDGTVRCWGRNDDSQLGGPAPDVCGQTLCARTPVTVVGLTNVQAISVGSDHTCALTTGGGVKCWGLNTVGQLGDNTTNEHLTPVDVCAGSPCSSNLSGVTAISAGGSHTCAVAGGAAKCWGWNASSQLGAPGADNCGFPCSQVPINVTGLTSGIADIGAGDQHTCAVTTGADVKCWGRGDSGQLGDNQKENSPTPVDACRLVPAIPQPACFTFELPNFAAVDLGVAHTCAVTTGGSIECWGRGNLGQLGNGTFTQLNTPFAVQSFAGGADFDRDGCPNTAEQQTGAGTQSTGGRRDSKNFWDFFDTPAPPNTRDMIISTGDIFRVVGRFGTNGTPTGNPFTTPPASGYHVAFDRSPPQAGADPWDLGPPDGSIAANDILFAVNQFGHTCA